MMRSQQQQQTMPGAVMRILFLAGGLSPFLQFTLLLPGVLSLEEVRLPHLDIYMLCRHPFQEEYFDHERVLDGYFSDLLPSAVDVKIEWGYHLLSECAGDTNYTEVEMVSEGVVEFSTTTVTEERLLALVTLESLQDYFQPICNSPEDFDARILPAGSSRQWLGNKNFAFCGHGEGDDNENVPTQDDETGSGSTLFDNSNNRMLWLILAIVTGCLVCLYTCNQRYNHGGKAASSGGVVRYSAVDE